jgi:hypothetical protein
VAKKDKASQVADEKTETLTLSGSNTLPATVKLSNGHEIALSEIATQAHANSGLTIAQWNELPNAERENRLNDVLQDIEALTGDVASRAYRVGVDRNFVYNGKTYKQDAKITMSPDAAAQHLATGALIEIT